MLDQRGRRFANIKSALVCRLVFTYRIKPEELYIFSCEKGKAEGRGLFQS